MFDSADFPYQLRPSKTATLLSNTDWSKTPLGPLHQWPDSHKSAVALCLNSQFPMTIALGDELVNIYNDGYIPIVGAKHPNVFGTPLRQAYAEIWDFLNDTMNRVRDNGEVIWHEDFLLPLIKQTDPEECYFTFCYSPLPNAAGGFDGVVSVATENTMAVVEKRRLNTSQILTAGLTAPFSESQLIDSLVKALLPNAMDAKQFALFQTSPAQAVQAQWATSAELLSRLQDSDELVIALQTCPCGAAMTAAGGVLLTIDCSGSNSPDGMLCLYMQPDSLVSQGAAFTGFANEIAALTQQAVDQARIQQDKLEHIEKQRDSREIMYRLIFDNAQDAIQFTAPDGRILASNPAATALLGFSEAELIKGGRDRFVEDSPELRAFLEQRRRYGRATMEIQLKRKDGSVFSAEVSSILFNDHYSGEERTVLIFRDVTAKKLAQQRTTTAAKLEAVGRLTGGISHDFNNFLNVIINSTDELLELLTEGTDEHLFASLASQASMKAADLTRQLLTLNQSETLAPRAINVAEQLEDMDQILTRAIGEHIGVRFRVSARNSTSYLDPSQLQSAILNLALNARDAMPGGGTLFIESRLESLDAERARTLELKDDAYIVVSVKDSGTGIAAEHLDKVFEPFFTTKQRDSGSGLGLSMIYSFIKQSGGGIELQSTLGQGTTVSLYLPLAKQQEAVKPGELNNVDNIRFAGERVLIVEDNPLVADSLRGMLSGAGLSVKTYVSAEDLLAALEAGERAKLILSDVILGAGMDGMELARNIRHLEPGQLVILMTGYMGTTEERHLDDSVYAILRKPFLRADVLSLIRTALDKGNKA